MICCLLSPIIWKTVKNVPYLLLTHFRCFQDKSPSDTHHSSHTSFLTTLHISIPFLLPLSHFEVEESELCQNQCPRCRCTTVGLHSRNKMFYSVMHADYSEFSTSQGVSCLQSITPKANKCLVHSQSISKVKMFQTPLFI